MNVRRKMMTLLTALAVATAPPMTYRITTQMSELTPTVAQAATTKKSVKKAKVSKLKKRYVFKGKAIKPKIKVKYGKKTLKKGRDYKLTYKCNKKIGTATIIIKGKGRYKGTKKVTFKIIPQATRLNGKLNVTNQSISASWNRRAKGSPGYQIQASEYKDFRAGSTITQSIKNNAKTKATLKGLKAGTTYYVRVRTYEKVNGKAYASNWSNPVVAYTQAKSTTTQPQDDETSTPQAKPQKPQDEGNQPSKPEEVEWGTIDGIYTARDTTTYPTNYNHMGIPIYIQTNDVELDDMRFVDTTGDVKFAVQPVTPEVCDLYGIADVDSDADGRVDGGWLIMFYFDKTGHHEVTINATQNGQYHTYATAKLDVVDVDEGEASWLTTYVAKKYKSNRPCTTPSDMTLMMRRDFTLISTSSGEIVDSIRTAGLPAWATYRVTDREASMLLTKALEAMAKRNGWTDYTITDRFPLYDPTSADFATHHTEVGVKRGTAAETTQDITTGMKTANASYVYPIDFKTIQLTRIDA